MSPRYVAIWALGVLMGLVIGFLVGRRKQEDRCRSMYRDTHGRLLRCRGVRSLSCPERLCPVHCRDLHQGACIAELLPDMKARSR